MRAVYWKDLEPDGWQKFRFAWAKLLWPICRLVGHDPFLLDDDVAYCWRCGYRLRDLDPR